MDEILKEQKEREAEIFNNIHQLQAAKQRLITGEKLPDIIYIDKEIPKFITTKEVHIYKSGFASAFVGASLAIYIFVGICYGLGYFTVAF